MPKTKRSFLEKLIGKSEEEDFSRQDIEFEQMETSGQDSAEIENDVAIRSDNFSSQNNQEPGEERYLENNQEEGGSADWSSDQEGQLTIDVYQTDTEIIIKSTIAGVKPQDLDVQINNDMVTIRGERKKEENINEEDYYYQECYWGSFSRSIILPVDVQAAKAEATMKDGILTIKLPKSSSAQSRKIQVRGF
ncbi:MAG: Hsp20 family protein [Candidatus Moranbacteria bacterium]|nr:Hsp20 family protein [Candidatus Moranbacteria bacterium]